MEFATGVIGDFLVHAQNFVLDDPFQGRLRIDCINHVLFLVAVSDPRNRTRPNGYVRQPRATLLQAGRS
jgi:hypothetical protein